jgi:hypothetical protein
MQMSLREQIRCIDDDAEATYIRHSNVLSHAVRIIPNQTKNHSGATTASGKALHPCTQLHALKPALKSSSSIDSGHSASTTSTAAQPPRPPKRRSRKSAKAARERRRTTPSLTRGRSPSVDSIDNETDEFTPVDIDRNLVLNLIQAQDDETPGGRNAATEVAVKKTSSNQ